jgi:hypothetical protein
VYDSVNETWEIIRDIVLPHTGRMIFTIAGFSLLGLLIAVLLIVIMFRKKVMTRSNLAYKIIIRIIYIPFILLVTIYSFGHLGFVRSVYKIMRKENPRIVKGVYHITVNQLFTTEIQKDIFLDDVKKMAEEAQVSGIAFAGYFEAQITERYLRDSSGNGFISKITRKYKKEIYRAALNGLLYAADAKFDTNIRSKEVDRAMDLLYSQKREKIEAAIKRSLSEQLQRIIDRYYHSALISGSLIWLLLMSIPFIEFFIYKKWIEKPQQLPVQ